MADSILRDKSKAFAKDSELLSGNDFAKQNQL